MEVYDSDKGTTLYQHSNKTFSSADPRKKIEQRSRALGNSISSIILH